MCGHCTALEAAERVLAAAEDNPEENNTPPTDPFDSPSYRDAA